MKLPLFCENYPSQLYETNCRLTSFLAVNLRREGDNSYDIAFALRMLTGRLKPKACASTGVESDKSGRKSQCLTDNYKHLEKYSGHEIARPLLLAT
jgi:hypothetical protein